MLLVIFSGGFSLCQKKAWFENFRRREAVILADRLSVELEDAFAKIEFELPNAFEKR